MNWYVGDEVLICDIKHSRKNSLIDPKSTGLPPYLLSIRATSVGLMSVFTSLLQPE